MTSKEFVVWLEGFLDAIHDVTLTSSEMEKCWSKIQDKAHSVSDSETPSTQWTPPYKSWESTGTGPIQGTYINTTTT